MYSNFTCGSIYRRFNKVHGDHRWWPDQKLCSLCYSIDSPLVVGSTFEQLSCCHSLVPGPIKAPNYESQLKWSPQQPTYSVWLRKRSPRIFYNSYIKRKMLNGKRVCKTRSSDNNQNMVAKAGDPIHSLSNNTNVFFQKVYPNREIRRRGVHNLSHTIPQMLQTSNKTPAYTSVPEKDPTPTPPCSATKLLDNSKQHVTLPQTAQKKKKRVYTTTAQVSVTRVAEKAISDAFQIKLDSANNVLKIALFTL